MDSLSEDKKDENFFHEYPHTCFALCVFDG